MNKKNIRVLHIANGDDCLGSAQCLYEILRYELDCIDIEPIVLTPEYTNINSFCEKNNIENYAIKYCEFMYPMHDKLAKIKYMVRKAEYYFYEKKSLNDIKSQIDFNNIDLVHTNNSLNDIGSRLAADMKKPHIWHLREGGLYQQNLHPYLHDYSEYMSNGNNTFIAVSNAVKDEWVKLGIPEEAITVIYDGVTLPNKQYFKHSDNKIRLVMTGSYSEIKGQIQVIKAVDKLPQEYKNKIHVDFWGKGVPEYVEYLKDEIEKKQLQNIIELKGFTHDVWETLSSYDIGLNCTRLEAFGRSTVEFLISGMPVIASDLGANVELVNNMNGVLFEYGNIEKLKNVIMYMIDNLSKYNSEKIADYAIKNYSCAISNGKIIEYFRKVYEREYR